jgi:hypothetical protein
MDMRKLTPIAALAAVLVCTSSALAGAPAAPPGSIGVQLMPSGTVSSDPLARSYVVGHLAPGSTITRTIQVSNTTKGLATISVYPAAASLKQGAFSFASGHSANDLSEWTAVNRRTLYLSAGGTALEKVTLTIPRLATKGERYGVIWAEVSSGRPNAGGFKLVNRVGIRMYVSVGPGGAPVTTFSIATLTPARAHGGGFLVHARVRNTGKSSIEVAGKLTISNGPGGLRAGPFEVLPGPSIAPGSSRVVTIALRAGLPRGPWRAHLGLVSKGIHRSRAGTITFPRAPALVKVPAKASAAGNHLIPVGAALIGGIGILGVALRIRRIRARAASA